MPSLDIWTMREVCDSKNHVYGMVISSWRKGCLVRALGKEELCAVADGQSFMALRGWLCPSPGRYQGYEFQASGVRMTVGAPGRGTQCKMQVIRAVEGSGVRSKGICFSLGAKDKAVSAGLWRHQVALLSYAFPQPLGPAQSAERRSPNHSLGCPTGAQGEGAL